MSKLVLKLLLLRTRFQFTALLFLSKSTAKVQIRLYLAAQFLSCLDQSFNRTIPIRVRVALGFLRTNRRLRAVFVVPCIFTTHVSLRMHHATVVVRRGTSNLSVQTRPIRSQSPDLRSQSSRLILTLVPMWTRRSAYLMTKHPKGSTLQSTLPLRLSVCKLTQGLLSPLSTRKRLTVLTLQLRRRYALQTVFHRIQERRFQYVVAVLSQFRIALSREFVTWRPLLHTVTVRTFSVLHGHKFFRIISHVSIHSIIHVFLNFWRHTRGCLRRLHPLIDQTSLWTSDFNPMLFPSFVKLATFLLPFKRNSSVDFRSMSKKVIFDLFQPQIGLHQLYQF